MRPHFSIKEGLSVRQSVRRPVASYILKIFPLNPSILYFPLGSPSLSVDGLSRPESVASSSSSCHEEQPGKLFVGSLAASVTEQDLYKYFSQFGEVKSCFIKFDLGTNKSRGFGFVVFRLAEKIDAK